VKAKNNFKYQYSILPIFGLVFLLLLSPCKIRNFIQAELGVAQTEVSNKNQTTINNSSCSDSETVSMIEAKEKSQSQKLPFIASNTDRTFATTVFNTTYPQEYKEGNVSTPAVPLYILYQNFKDYL